MNNITIVFDNIDGVQSASLVDNHKLFRRKWWQWNSKTNVSSLCRRT